MQRNCSIFVPSRERAFTNSPALRRPVSTRPVKIRPINGSAPNVVANIEKGSAERSACFGGSTCRTINSNNAVRSFRGPSKSTSAQPALPDAYNTGKSSCCSSASNAAKRSKHSSKARSGSPSGLSTLFTTTIGFKPNAKALEVTNFVCGIGPSAASTNKTTPSTMDKIRSTSPPKSAWPGVSTILIRIPCQSTEVAFAKIVMPRSRSRSLLSMARSVVAWFSRYVPDCFNNSSTKVVLPWSTCAMIAMLRRSIGCLFLALRGAYTAPRRKERVTFLVLTPLVQI